MTRSFYTQSGQRLRGVATTNSRNDSVLSWSNPSSLTISGVRLQPISVEEIRETRTGEVVTHRLLCPVGSDILRADRWVQDGITYDVDGDGRTYLSPSGAAQHMEVHLRRVVG